MKSLKYVVFIILTIVITITLTGCSDKKETKNDVKIDKADNVEIDKAEETKKVEPVTVKVGEAIKTDDYKMTIGSIKVKSEIEYKTGKYSTYSLEVENGKKAICISGVFTNKRGSKIDAWYMMKGQVVIDDQYTYDLTFKAWQDLEPLVDADYVLYAQIPNKLAEKFKKAEFTFGHKNDYTYMSEGIEGADKLFSVTYNR